MPYRRRHPEPAAQLAWPWRDQCTLTLQAGGMRFLPAIRTAMQGATQTIDIEMYLCASGALFDEWLRVLAARVADGVRVRMLLDDIGCRELATEDWQRLQQAGVTVRRFNRLQWARPLAALVRDHRKLVLVDGRRAWVGGFCVNDESDPRIFGDDAWFDAMVACRGPVVSDFAALFEQAWALAGRGPITDALRWRLQKYPPPRASETGRCEGWARVRAARGGRNNPVLRAFVHHILRAQREVWLCTPYFLPPRSLYKALLLAARRGVDVRLTVPGRNTDHPVLRYAGHHLYQRLLQAGVRIEEYQPRFLHLKAARVDDWCTLGSFNYDRWNSSWNLEANVEIIDSDFCHQLHTLQQSLARESQPVAPNRWQRRRPWQRWREKFWYWFGTRLILQLKTLWNTATVRRPEKH